MSGVTEGRNLEANLEILGKIKRGNMLAKAGDDGKLVRKTNWLTQAANKEKTHDDALFDQIKTILKAAEEKIDEDPDGQKELIQQYIQANKGLEILLSTYRSKGSKETYLIDKLTLLLAEHVKNFETTNSKVDPTIQTLKKHAEQAIKYVNDCRIRSTNNIWGNSYFGSEYDTILFGLLVRGASSTKIGASGKKLTVKDLKTVVASIVRRPISRKEKKELLAETLNDMMFSQYKTENENLGLKWLNAKVKGTKSSYAFFQGSMKPFISFEIKENHTKPMEVHRIKLAKRAIRTRLGNCFDKAAVVATHLIENTKGAIEIFRVGGDGENPYDHAWVLISKDENKLWDAIYDSEKKILGQNGNYMKLFPKDTWVVDGWTRDWWQLRAWTNSLCNPRQMYVRGKIRKAIKSGKISYDERVTWPPQPTMAWFRLRFAHLTALDWNMLEENGGMQWQDFKKAVEILKNSRNDLAQIFDSKLVEAVIYNEDVELLAGNAHNSTSPIQEEISKPPSSPSLGKKEARNNSLAVRESIKSNE
jgi:hypothetical protein